MSQFTTAQLDALNAVKQKLLAAVADEQVYNAILQKLSAKELKHLQEFFGIFLSRNRNRHLQNVAALIFLRC